MAGSCGSCTFCCKVMEVVELQKPRNEWCGHCTKGKGCGVYETRPQSCADFRCFWLESQSWPTGVMPESLRPDKSRVMLCGGVDDCLVVNVDPGYPGAWRDKKITALLDGWRATSPTPIYVAIGNRRIGWRDGAEYEFAA